MRPTGTPRPARDTSVRSLLRRARLPLLLAAAALLATGCSADQRETWRRGGFPEGVTSSTDRTTTLWQGSWVAALIVGALVWGLIFFAIVRFRRRASDTGLPPQVRYNVPVEALYTTLPLIVVLVFFYFTARDEAELVRVSDETDQTVEVVGKRWSWDFNYLDAGGQAVAFETGTPGVPPTLYLPVDQSVKFVLYSRDVIHDFWVPNFLFKMDVIPGRVNEFQVTPTKIGRYAGKCAELCGIDHSRMLFNVEIVSAADFDAHLQELAQRGQSGGLPPELGPRVDAESSEAGASESEESQP